MIILFLIIGLILLWFGAELVVNGAIDIAKHYKISPLFLGLTIISLGTDLPETFIVLVGSWHKLQGDTNSNLILGEIIGSSISQISLILGIVGILGYVTIKRRTLIRDGAMLILSVVVLFLVAYDGNIKLIEGCILLLVYGFYIFNLFREERVQDKFKVTKRLNKAGAFISLGGGLGLLILASNITITNALLLSEQWNIPQVFVGTIIVGLGTSLPELLTAIQAVRRRIGGLAIGSLLGSNIYDVLVPVGLGAIIAGFEVSDQLLHFDIPVLFLISCSLIIFFRKDKKLSKKESIALIALYLIYFTIQFVKFNF